MTKNESFNSLRKMVKNCSYEVSNKYRVSEGLAQHISREDLEQTGLLAAWQCISKFDDTKFSLKTYAYKRVRGSMLDELRKTKVLSKKEHVRNANFTDINESVHDNLVTPSNLSDGIDVKKILAQQSDQNKFIINKLIEGYSQVEIAKMLNVSKSRISQIVLQLRTKFKRDLLV